MLHVLDICHCGLFGSVDDNDYGANNAIEAADFSDKTEPFLQKYGGQDGSDDDGKRSERSDQNGVHKGVCSKVTYLPYYHKYHAGPPPSIF